MYLSGQNRTRTGLIYKSTDTACPIFDFGFGVYDFFAFLQNRDSSLAAPIHTLNSAHTKHKLVNPRYQ